MKLLMTLGCVAGCLASGAVQDVEARPSGSCGYRSSYGTIYYSGPTYRHRSYSHHYRPHHYRRSIHSYHAPVVERRVVYHYPARQVIVVQKALTRRGYHCGGIDGVYGAQTRSAVKRYQFHHGIRPTGILCSTTRYHLGVRF